MLKRDVKLQLTKLISPSLCVCLCVCVYIVTQTLQRDVTACRVRSNVSTSPVTEWIGTDRRWKITTVISCLLSEASRCLMACARTPRTVRKRRIYNSHVVFTSHLSTKRDFWVRIYTFLSWWFSELFTNVGQSFYPAGWTEWRYNGSDNYLTPNTARNSAVADNYLT